jgi:hypothetical protein
MGHLEKAPLRVGGSSGAGADVNREENRQPDAGYYIAQSNARTATAPAPATKTADSAATTAAAILALLLALCASASLWK